MMKLAAVFFDLDGTLVDTAPDFLRIINQLRKEEGLQSLSMTEFRPSVSNGALAMIACAFPNHTADQHEDLRQRLLAKYLDQPAEDSQLFNGLETTLQWLEQSQRPWGIVTNKPWQYTEPLLIHLGLAQRSRSTICPEHVAKSKPNPEGLFAACKEADTTANHCIYIGDHERDIAAGRSAGMITIAANYGYLQPGDDASHWQADYVVDDSMEILPLLQQIAEAANYKN